MVAIGKAGAAPVMRAVFREGIGCVIMAPDQTDADIASLPFLDLPPPAGDAATIPWPNGDKVADAPLPANIDAKGPQAASDWAFTRPSAEQVTLSLLVVHKGRIVHERYAPGVDVTTRTRTWSTAKSIASTLIGILVDQGKLHSTRRWPSMAAAAPRRRGGSARRDHAAARAAHVERPRDHRQRRARVRHRIRHVVLGGRQLGRRRAQSRVSSASPARAGTTRTTTRCSRSTR